MGRTFEVAFTLNGRGDGGESNSIVPNSSKAGECNILNRMTGLGRPESFAIGT